MQTHEIDQKFIFPLFDLYNSITGSFDEELDEEEPVEDPDVEEVPDLETSISFSTEIEKARQMARFIKPNPSKKKSALTPKNPCRDHCAASWKASRPGAYWNTKPTKAKHQ